MRDLMRRTRDGFRHAFAMDDGRGSEPTPEEREIIERVLGEVRRRRLVTPAIFLLESSRPLGRVSAAAIHFLTPMATLIVDRRGLELLASFLERRGAIDWLCARLEEFDREPSAGSPTDRSESLRVAEPEDGDLRPH